MKNRSLISIIFLGIVIFAGLLFSVYKITSKDKTYFYANGYVSISDAEASSKIYFTEGTSYKNGYNNEIIFKDDTEKKQEVSKYSFVFYQDKTISYLNDGVLMDLNDLSTDFIPYYNIKNNYLIKYTSGKYIIEGKEKNIILNNFIGKIDENKYIVAGNDLRLKLSSSEEYINNYYFELIFLEGDIVKINNQAINLETISEECYILVGDDIKIDLSKKAIFYEDTLKANLSEIVIDHDENIDIAYKEDKPSGGGGAGGGNGTGGGTGGGAGGAGGNGNGEGGTGGNGGGAEQEPIIETVVEYKNIPYVEVISSDINSRRLNLKFNVIDKHNLITGPVTVRYLNTATSEVFTKEYPVYSDTIEFFAENMMSSTRYIVTISASYIRNGNVYKDYIMFQRTFETNDIGVSLTKDFVTSDQISYKINFDKESSFQGGTLNIYDSKGNKVDSYDFTNDHQPISVTFDELKSNESYTAKIENIRYGNVTYTSGYAAMVQNKTLKYNPFKDGAIISNPIATINKIDYKFKFDLGLINDKDAIIKQVEYRIIDKTTNEVVKTIKKSDTNSIEVKIGDEIKDHTTYYFNAKITMKDNEKTVYYTTLNSNDFNMDNKLSPTVQFINGEITANTINGQFIITDPDAAVDTKKEVYVEYVNSLGDVKRQNLEYTKCEGNQSETTKCVNVNISDLISSDTYTLNLMSYVDLNDEETTPGITKIGAVKIQTQKADIIKTNLSSTMLDETDPDLLSKVFEVKVNLALGDETPEIIRDTMERFDIMLYEGVDASGAYLGAIHIDSAERDIVKDFFDETQTYTLKDFGLTLEDLQRLHITDNGQISKTYTIRLTNGKSGENYVEFRPASLTFEINEVLLGLLNNGASIAVDPILNNSELENYDKTLSEGTAIGLLITPEFNNKKYVNKINFQIYDVTDAENPSEPKEIIYDVDLEDESVIEPYEIYLNSDDADDDFLRRGRVYRVQYTLSLDLNGDGETDLVYPYELDNIDKPKPVVSEEIALKKQIPTMIVFPWTSDGTTITYKYKHEDKDGSVELVDPENKIDAKLYYKVGDSALPAEKVACPNASLDKGFVTSYTCSKLNNLNAGDKYTLMLNAQLIEREDGYEFVEISDYYFEGQITLDNISLELEKEGNLPKYNNIISIKIKNTNGANELVSALNRIAKYSATITYGNESFVISNIGKMQNYNQEVAYTVDGKAQFKATINDVAYIEETEDGETILYIDYSKIYTYEANELGSKFKALKGKDGLTVTVSAMYDTGKVGYLASTKNKYAFQIVSPGLENELPTYNYLVHYGANTFLSSPYALNAVYTYDNIQAEGFVDDRIADLYVGNEKIYFNNEFLKAGTKGYVAANLGYKITLNGVILQDTYPIIAKELGTANINGALDFRYDEVIPTVALTSSETTINGLKFSYDIAGINASFSDIKTENDDKFIYFEVLDGDTLVKEIKVSLNEDHVQKIDLKDHKGTLKRINNTYKTDIKRLTTASGVVLDGSKYSYHYQDGSLLVPGESGTVTAVFDYVIDALDVNKTYTLKSYVKMGASGEKRYLTHGERENLYKDFEYEFTTKDVKKGIFTDSDKTFKVESLNDYATRNLISTFKVSEIIGLEKLEYEIYNADGFAVNTAQYETCKDSYNSVGGTCFTKTDKGYTASIKHDISIKDSYDFVFGTNYTIKVKATVNTTVGEIVYEEVYNTSKPVDKLKEPKVTVTKSSHVNADGSYLNFSIKIEDLDRVVSKYNLANKGQYTVWLAEGSDRTRVTEKETYNIIQNGTELIKTLKYTDLKPNTAYYLMVEYGTYTNNQGENVKREYLIPYLIYTLDDNKISVGRIDFTPITTTDPGTGSLLKFGYASNFVEEENNEDQEAYVAGINYTIRRTSGDATFNISDRKLFAPGEIEYKKNDDAENNNMGENYYQIVLSPTVYKDIANYEITFSFYLGGKITEGYTKDTCLGSNWWDENTSTCYILNTDVIYSAERQYGGAK